MGRLALRWPVCSPPRNLSLGSWEKWHPVPVRDVRDPACAKRTHRVTAGRRHVAEGRRTSQRQFCIPSNREAVEAADSASVRILLNSRQPSLNLVGTARPSVGRGQPAQRRPAKLCRPDRLLPYPGTDRAKCAPGYCRSLRAPPIPICTAPSLLQPGAQRSCSRTFPVQSSVMS